jgi:hypothetical protein
MVETILKQVNPLKELLEDIKSTFNVSSFDLEKIQLNFIIKSRIYEEET